MKFFAVFAAVLALAAAAPASLTTQWTLNDLSEAIQNPATPAEVIPYIEEALNTMMEQLFAGQHVDSIAIPTPVGLLPVEAVEAAVPGSLTTQWTLNDLSEAIQNPATPAEMIPYIEAALNTMMEQLFAGQHVESIVIPTPVGLLPVEAVEAASPAAVMPVGVVEAPVAPEVVVEPVPAAINDASGSPLVQIIVNIKSQEVDAESIAIPTPVGLLPVEAVEAAVPGSLTTQWTLNDLSEAIQNPATPVEMIPYIEAALNTMMEQLFAGQHVESIAIPTPVGLLPVEAAVPGSLTTQWTLNDLSEAIQNPATPVEMIPYIEAALNTMMEQLFAGQHVESIVIPTPVGLLPVEAVEAASPAAVMPVGVVEAPVAPESVVSPVPAAINDASGSPLVQIIVNIKSQEVVAEAPAAVEEPSPVLIPEPVIVAPSPVEIAPVPEPIVIAPLPVIPVNPIDVIAVGTPEINPIDLLQPVPVAVAAGETQEGILV